MKQRIIILLFILLVAMLLPSKTKGDTIVPPPEPLIEEPVPVELIQIPSKLREELVPYYLMVHEAFKNDPVMKDVAMCESGYKPWEVNETSGATGLFQILKSTWKLHQCTGDPKDAADNIACAQKILENAGSPSDWNESRYCWDH